MRTPTLGFKLSQAALNTASPPISQAFLWATQYVPTPGRPLLDMSQGSPGYPPPKILLDTIATASANPRSCGYLPNAGDPLLREALANEMKTVYGKDIDVQTEDISLTAGCNMAFVAAIRSVTDAGDEVIVPAPWYFNHQMSLDMLDIKTIPLPTSPSDGFLPSPHVCGTLVTPKTKAIVLVTPNNPTGAVYPPSLIASFGMLAKQHGVVLIIDETYRDFVTTGVPHELFATSSLLSDDWSWRSHFIHLFSFSKSYCVPGHRLGAIVATPQVLVQIDKMLDNIQICPPRPVQHGLQPLLPALRPFIDETSQKLLRRHQLFRSLLPRPWRIGSQGAYYAFVRHPFKNIPSLDVSRRLAMEIGVITLPSTFFLPKFMEGLRDASEMDRWIRFSVANMDDENLQKVCQRLASCQDQFGWEVELE
ncbi:PLP-dependent transferase [Rickenella mellea]|uniref:PLP-dependent transferase n=1 Tax=Rickenella mellea TaxID=50990 RepID=A0A4R5XGB0_9AGAM|nr:PLP-dependent transferase [Rickenella mellea]